jgi:hypothetical protein
MSYTEYLRRKAQTTPKIIDTRINTDASMFTMTKRLAASSSFSTTNRKAVISNTLDPHVVPGNLVALQSTTKVSGGRVPDASSFTAYMGSVAIDADYKNGYPTGKVTLPANLPTTLCTTSFVNGPTPQRSASDWVRSQVCTVACRQPHTATELGPPIWVGDTIAPNRSVGVTTTYVRDTNGTYLGVNRVDITPTTGDCDRVIHTHPAVTPYASWSARPTKIGNPVYTVPSPSDARKVGDYNPSKVPYVEKHHGNDLKVQRRAVPFKYQIPKGAPAHLKINDPQVPKVPY